MFKGLEDEEDEDVEINEMMNEYKKKGGVIIGEMFNPFSPSCVIKFSKLEPIFFVEQV